HDLIAGLDYSKASLKTKSFQGTPDPLNLFRPVYGAPFDTPNDWINDKQTGTQTGLYLQDQMKLWNSLTIVGGVRKDWATLEVEDILGGKATEQKDEAVTYRLGAIYQLPFGLAPYVSYAESFTPVGDVDANGNFFKPETATQYEAGIKFQPKGLESSV